MKALLYLFSFAPLALFGGTISIGDSLKQTIETLGKPVGTIELRNKSLLLYPQGEVTLKNDHVSHIDLISEEEFAADQARLKQEREEWQFAQEQQSTVDKEEGEAVKASKLNSRSFELLSAKDKVDYWRNFQTRYPSVDASNEIIQALETYEKELTEIQKQQQISELESRVTEAELAATEARLETERFRRRSFRGGSFHRSDFNNFSPFIHSGISRSRSSSYYYKRPTVTIYGNEIRKQRFQGQKIYTQKGSGSRFQSRGQEPVRREGTAERVSRILNEAKAR